MFLGEVFFPLGEKYSTEMVVEGGQPLEELYVEVAVDPGLAGLEKTLHYRVPDPLRGLVEPGQRVSVPLGNRSVEGLVLCFVDRPEVQEIKDVRGLIDEIPILGQDLLQLGLWMADRYMCPPGEVFRTIIPPGVRRDGRRVVSLVEAAAQGSDGVQGKAFEAEGWQVRGRRFDEVEQRLLDALHREGRIEIRRLGKIMVDPGWPPALENLKRLGLVRVDTVYEERQKPKLIRVLELAQDELAAASALEDLGKAAPKQAAALRRAIEAGAPLTAGDFSRKAGVSPDALRALVRKGLLRERVVEESRDPFAGRDFGSSLAKTLTGEQRAALEDIRARLTRREPGTILLHGVTGSGKTEVYLQAISEVLAEGGQALVIVPEISLTPQMIERFKSRFGDQVAVLHSRLGEGERYDEWRRIRSGRVSIAVGARSAVFAPFERLKLIVLDEEHENTYKQQEAPRYQAREVAEERARAQGELLVLGSATPSVETYTRALRGDIGLRRLTSRIDSRPLPAVEVVDLREELASGNRGIFSRLLRGKLAERLSRGEQSILFLNRRGYSTFVLCRSCGHVMKCPHCEVSLTYHFADAGLQCHYCGHREKSPELCPSCGSKYIRYFGAGTERVEEEFKKIFPKSRVLRMDVDTTRRKGSHEEILARFGRGEAGVLIGTQMVAKGLDFGRVTLVGVIAADTSLNFPDFRSGERTFQLLTQVAGRAGRGEVPGEVVIQTYNPDHYSILAARNHDFEAFYNQEIQIRRELGYPPFAQLVNILIWGKSEEAVADVAGRLGQALPGASRALREASGDGAPGETSDEPVRRESGGRPSWESAVIGPSPAPLAKLKGNYRWQVAVRGPDLEGLKAQVAGALRSLPRKLPEDTRVAVDVNPSSMI